MLYDDELYMLKSNKIYVMLCYVMLCYKGVCVKVGGCVGFDLLIYLIFL